MFVPRSYFWYIYEMQNCYVYRHVREDKNEPFYIGIGTIGKRDKKYYRAFCAKRNNEIWNRIVSKSSYYVEIVQSNLTWEEAVKMEKYFIGLYGKICDGSGILSNITNGGEGCYGMIHSSETRDKISLKKLGAKLTADHKLKISKANKGLIRSEESRKNMSKAQKSVCDINEKRIRAAYARSKVKNAHSADANNKRLKTQSRGVIGAYKDGKLTGLFLSGRNAALKLKLCHNHVNGVLNGKLKSHKGYHFILCIGF